jgi:hypothetical protein
MKFMYYIFCMTDFREQIINCLRTKCLFRIVNGHVFRTRRTSIVLYQKKKKTYNFRICNCGRSDSYESLRSEIKIVLSTFLTLSSIVFNNTLSYTDYCYSSYILPSQLAIIIIMSLVTGLFFLAILLNQQ